MEKLIKISAIYAMISAIALIAVWILIITFGFFKHELRDNAIQSYFLFAAEILTACLLFFSAIGLLKKSGSALKLFYISMGMMLYAVILAAGKFLGIGHVYFSSLFTAVAVATAVLLCIHVLKIKYLE